MLPCRLFCKTDPLARAAVACSNLDVRDRVVLLTDFALTGLRRTEIAALRVEQLVQEESEPA